MFRVVLFQFASSLIVAVLWAALAGSRAAITALLGGLACTVPNGLFAFHLALLARKRQAEGGGLENPASGSAAPQALAILFGEFFKVALTVGLLAVLILGYRVVWPALLASVAAVLIVQPLALAWRPRGRRAGP